jgi:hypothetical protein
VADVIQHQRRIVDEKAAVDAKIERLNDFMDTSIFAALDDEDQDLLKEQESYMRGYSAVLERRIANFKNGR